MSSVPVFVPLRPLPIYRQYAERNHRLRRRGCGEHKLAARNLALTLSVPARAFDNSLAAANYAVPLCTLPLRPPSYHLCVLPALLVYNRILERTFRVLALTIRVRCWLSSLAVSPARSIPRSGPVPRLPTLGNGHCAWRETTLEVSSAVRTLWRRRPYRPGPPYHP
jgi:hypothetical protein